MYQRRFKSNRKPRRSARVKMTPTVCQRPREVRKKTKRKIRKMKIVVTSPRRRLVISRQVRTISTQAGKMKTRKIIGRRKKI